MGGKVLPHGVLVNCCPFGKRCTSNLSVISRLKMGIFIVGPLFSAIPYKTIVL